MREWAPGDPYPAWVALSGSCAVTEPCSHAEWQGRTGLSTWPAAKSASKLCFLKGTPPGETKGPPAQKCPSVALVWEGLPGRGAGGTLQYLGTDPAAFLLLQSPSRPQPQDSPPPHAPGPLQVPLPELWGQVVRPQAGPPPLCHVFPLHPCSTGQRGRDGAGTGVSPEVCERRSRRLTPRMQTKTLRETSFLGVRVDVR